MALSLSVQITRCSAKKYGINHLTSSPYWPQGNGKAESAVKIVKSLLKKSDEFELALLHYLNTPLKGHTLSPVQRSFGRRTHHILPVSKEALAPQCHSSCIVQAEIAAKHSSAKVSYDRHAHVDLSDNSQLVSMRMQNSHHTTGVKRGSTEKFCVRRVLGHLFCPP